MEQSCRGYELYIILMSIHYPYELPMLLSYSCSMCDSRLNIVLCILDELFLFFSFLFNLVYNILSFFFFFWGGG